MLKIAKFSFLCCWILLAMNIIGCSTHTITAYDGEMVNEKDIVTLGLANNKFDGPYRVNIQEIDGKNLDNKDNSKWDNNLGPASIKFLPGKHSLLVEYFIKKRSFLSPDGLPSRKTVTEGIITFLFEPGHRYELEVDRRTLDTNNMTYTIKDMTAGGSIVFPQIAKSLPFDLSEIPKDKSVVCFYRPWRLLSAIVTYYVSESKMDITKLPNKSLFHHVTDPGDHNYSLTFGGLAPVTDKYVNLQPGAIIYLKADVVTGKLVPVRKDDALKEISEIESSK